MKKNKVKKTAKQKVKNALKVILSIVLTIAVLFGIATCVNIVGVKSNANFVSENIKKLEYENQYLPVLDENGNYTFTTKTDDSDFKVMQLTDIHIGGGFMSIRKDNMALNAVAAMISAEKPDLVVVTGDVAYPVPFQAGTINNKRPAILFADLMEKLGVYWCVTFGNHDTEAYSFFDREAISHIYSNSEKYPHCLFKAGPDDVDGFGNSIINIKTPSGKIIQSLYMLDSHSYTDNDYFGIMWKYDCVHKNQIEWYKNSVAQLTEDNNGITPKSIMFMHIPVRELRDAYYEYRDNGFKDTENTKFLGGKAGESKAVVYSSDKNNGLFDACLESGSTQAMFFGHDHLNNFSLDYKGIQLGYAFSVDYLAYSGISKYGAQRGCSLITIKPDGSFERTNENYYQDKYTTVNPKETVSMGEFKSEG